MSAPGRRTGTKENRQHSSGRAGREAPRAAYLEQRIPVDVLLLAPAAVVVTVRPHLVPVDAAPGAPGRAKRRADELVLDGVACELEVERTAGQWQGEVP